MVLLLLLLGFVLVRSKGLVDPAECQIWGPGLHPDKIVMPARYFYIVAADKHKHK